jgi:hypothetical protein
MRGKAREGEDQPSCEAACDSRMAFTMFTPPATSYNGYKEDIKHLRWSMDMQITTQAYRYGTHYAVREKNEI